ncbi:hypothetical protein SDC9_121104 [bioreactor metagenome]|uniref:Uncharacterized protein n=1 Tax=bioreactor metagenome TaxID=1076179 RepID=A0A645CB07_9ZZZZ
MDVGTSDVELDPEVIGILLDSLVLQERVLGELIPAAVLENEILLHGEGWHDSLGIPFFGNVAHSGFNDMVWRFVCNVLPKEQDLTAFNLSQAVYGFGKFALAVARNPCKTDNLTTTDGEVQVLEGQKATVALDVEVLEIQNRSAVAGRGIILGQINLVSGHQGCDIGG